MSTRGATHTTRVKHVYEVDGVKYDSIDVIINTMLERELQRIPTGSEEFPLCPAENDFGGICHIDRYSSSRARILFVPKHVDLDTITSFVVQRFGANQTIIWIQNIGIKMIAAVLLELVLRWLMKNTDWDIEVRICALQPIDNPTRGKVRSLMTLVEKLGGKGLSGGNDTQHIYSIDCSQSISDKNKKEEKKHG